MTQILLDESQVSWNSLFLWDCLYANEQVADSCFISLKFGIHFRRKILE